MASRAPKPVGPIVEDVTPRPMPSRDATLKGRYVTLVGLHSEHADALFPHISGNENSHLWTYMLDGPFEDPEEWRQSIATKAKAPDMVFYSITSTTEYEKNGSPKVLGMASYLRIDPKHQSIEVGSVMFSPALQRTPAATEAMYLMAKYAFETLGYRRYEWKCHALNGPSNRAARRLGFEFEGIFRSHLIVKGRNRDTAWYSILIEEWPLRKAELEKWLEPANFDTDGKQKARLEDFRKEGRGVKGGKVA